MQAMQGLKALLPYMLDESLEFSPCGTMSYLKFRIAGDVAEYGALDQGSWIVVHRSRELESTRSTSIARDIFATVDRVSKILWSRFNSEFGESPINKWLCIDAPIKIGLARIVGSWDRGPWVLGDLNRPKSFSELYGLRFS